MNQKNNEREIGNYEINDYSYLIFRLFGHKILF